MQTSYSLEPAVAAPGLLADIGLKDVVSRLNSSKQLVTLTPTPANATAFTVTINGTLFSFTSDGDGTAAEIVAGLIALINAGQAAVVASGTSTLILTAAVEGVAFTLANSANMAAVVNVPGAEKIPFGTFVTRNGDDVKVRLPNVTGEVAPGLGGVAISHQALESVDDGLAAGYVQGKMVNVLRKGRVWVKVEEAVTQGDAAFVRYASGAGGSQRGAFRKSADTSTAVALTGARYLTSADANGFAQLELNL